MKPTPEFWAAAGIAFITFLYPSMNKSYYSNDGKGQTLPQYFDGGASIQPGSGTATLSQVQHLNPIGGGGGNAKIGGSGIHPDQLSPSTMTDPLSIYQQNIASLYKDIAETDEWQKRLEELRAQGLNPVTYE